MSHLPEPQKEKSPAGPESGETLPGRALAGKSVSAEPSGPVDGADTLHQDVRGLESAWTRDEANNVGGQIAAAAGSIRWTMLTGIDAAGPLIHRAAVDAGFRTQSRDGAEIRVDVPRSLRRRRGASHLTGWASTSARGTEIDWRAEESGAGHAEHLLRIEENLPQGVMYYHGLGDAAARAGLDVCGQEIPRSIVGALDRDETVCAIGKGHLDDKPGFVVLTGKRLLVVEKRITGADRLLDIPHHSIKSLSLGKKISGEILRIALAAADVEISRLGHGEGYGIATSFREIQKERARSSPGPP